jgi:hypothetical protein
MSTAGMCGQAFIPLVDVEGERWAWVWWDVHEHGISQMGTVRDGG